MKIGTIGTGNIVEEILDAVSLNEGISCEAVYSRKYETGKKLADKYGVYKVYTDLKEMLSDDEIDFIYIASPNSLHYKYSKMALEAGKNVLCEKPFTSTLKEAMDLKELALKKHLYLLEAISTMYLPNFEIIKQQLHKVGDVKLVQASYCQYSRKYDALKAGETPNVFNLEFSGGSLMDINLYNIYLTFGLFGIPKGGEYFPNIHKNGIDTSGTLIMKYPEFICECTAAKDTWGINSYQIQGDEGYIYVKDGSNGCNEVLVVTKTDSSTYNEQHGHHRLYYEIKGIVKMIEEDDYQDCLRRLDRSVEVVRYMEKIRKNAGLFFPADGE